jgi:hypothetical protein
MMGFRFQCRQTTLPAVHSGRRQGTAGDRCPHPPPSQGDHHPPAEATPLSVSAPESLLVLAVFGAGLGTGGSQIGINALAAGRAVSGIGGDKISTAMAVYTGCPACAAHDGEVPQHISREVRIMPDPCIITVAITGSVPRKENNPAVPISIAEQVEFLYAEPWEPRRAALASLLRNAGDGVRLSEHLEGAQGPAMFHHACSMGLEGIVSKRRDAPYRSGRCSDWIKMGAASRRSSRARRTCKPGLHQSVIERH